MHKSYKSNEVVSWSNNPFLINAALLTSQGVIFSPHPLCLTEHLPFPLHTSSAVWTASPGRNCSLCPNNTEEGCKMPLVPTWPRKAETVAVHWEKAHLTPKPPLTRAIDRAEKDGVQSPSPDWNELLLIWCLFIANPAARGLAPPPRCPE